MTAPTAPTPAQPSGPRGLRVSIASLLALGLVATHFASFDIAEQAIATDIRYYVYFAWQLTEGVPPHLSGFDPKTQLATFAGALFHALGESLGADPLLAIRAGYLGIGATCAWLFYVVHRRLGGGAVAGGLGLLAVCAFSTIAALSAVGNWPKALMALATVGAGLLVHGRRWTAAGAVSMLAFLDWQIGALVVVSVLASAVLFGERRLAALVRAALGAGLVLALYVGYFAAHDALGAAIEQSLVSSFHRGEAFTERRTFAGDLERLQRLVRRYSAGQYPLVLAGLGGIPVALWRAWQWRRDARLRLLFPVGAVFLGVIVFTFVDFQALHDTAILLYAVAFFLGLLAVFVHEMLTRLMPARRALAALLCLTAAAVLARPGPFHPAVEVNSRVLGTAASLSDQRDVARKLARRTRDRTLGVLQSSELLTLLPYVNPLPTIYWNVANLSYFRETEDEAADTVVARLLDDAGVDALLFFSRRDEVRLGPGWTQERIRSDNDEYGITLYLREVDGD